MNIFEKIASAFAPKKEAQTLPVAGYEGAQNFTYDRSFLYKTGHDEETQVTYARAELLETTRYLIKNSPILEKIRLTVENYSVGPGISVQANSSDKEFNKTLTKQFDNWCRSPLSSHLNDLTFYEIQRLVASELIIAGEVFLVLMKSSKGWPELQIVKSERVKSTGKKSDKSVDGLFLDGDGRVVAYQIFFGKKPTTVQAQDVIHIKRVTEPGQLRGISTFASALNALRDHKDLVLLEKKALKAHSVFAAAVKKKSGGDVGDGTFGAATRNNTKRAGTRAQANPALERIVGGGQVAYLAEGEELQLMASSRTNDAYQGFLNFLELLAREVCLTSGLPYDFVVNPNQTGPGMRFIISDAAAVFEAIQLLITDRLIARVFPWVAASLMKRGDITLTPPNDWYLHSCTLPESITIDQGRRDAADLNFLNAGLTTYDEFYSARGKNWEAQLSQRINEQEWIIKECEKRNIPPQIFIKELPTNETN